LAGGPPRSLCDPLACARCAGAMRIIAVIEQSEVIAKILTQLDR